MIDELKDKYFKPNEQIEIYNKYKTNLDNKDKYELALSIISERSFWGYFELVAVIIYELAEVSNEYLNLIETLHTKVRYDLAQAPFFKTLKKIGVNKREIALPLYEKIFNDAKQNETKIMAGIILGAYCKQDEKTLLAYLKKELSVPMTNSILKAIITCYDEKLPQEIYTYIDKVSKTTDKEILRELANVCLIYYKQDEKYFYEKIKSLIELKDDMIRYIVFDRLTFQEIIAEKDVLVLVSQSLDSNEQVIEKILDVLRKYPNEYQQVSEWLIRIINNGLDTKLRNFDWVLEELAKSNKLFIDYFLDNYKKIRRDNQNTYTVLLPHLFNTLAKHHIDYSTEMLNKLDLADEEQRRLFYELNRVILGHIYTQISYSQSLLRLIDGLLKVATKREYISINMSRYEEIKNKKEITQEEFNSLVNFTQNLLQQLSEIKEYYDFKSIHDNIRKYPLVYSYAKNVLIESERKKQYTPLLWLGETEEPKLQDIKITPDESELNKAFKIQHTINQFWSRAYLTELNESLELVSKFPNGKFIGKDWAKYVGDSMRSERKFWGLFSELIFINKFDENSIKEIEPKVPNRSENNFDLKVNLAGKDSYFEITYPEIDRELKLAYGAVGLGNKSFSVVDKKYGQIFSKQTLEEMEQKKRSDLFFIVIDTSQSTIDEDQLLNTLYGSLSLTWVQDKQSGRTVEQYVSRQQDSITDKNQKTKVISGIIYFKKELSFQNGQPCIVLIGNIIINPTAINKPTEKELRQLKEIIFD